MLTEFALDRQTENHDWVIFTGKWMIEYHFPKKTLQGKYIYLIYLKCKLTLDKS